MITAVCCNLIGNRLLHIFYICIECTPSKITDIQLIADDLKLQIKHKNGCADDKEVDKRFSNQANDYVMQWGTSYLG